MSLLPQCVWVSLVVTERGKELALYSKWCCQSLRCKRSSVCVLFTLWDSIIFVGPENDAQKCCSAIANPTFLFMFVHDQQELMIAAHDRLSRAAASASSRKWHTKVHANMAHILILTDIKTSLSMIFGFAISPSTVWICCCQVLISWFRGYIHTLKAQLFHLKQHFNKVFSKSPLHLGKQII